MKKSVIVILLVLSLLIPATSCSAPNTIEVTSKDYPKLTKMSPSEFDIDAEIVRESAHPDYEYLDYVCYLTVEDGNLRVENNVDYYRTTQEEIFNFGYLVGVNIGEFDGWVRWFPYHTSHYPEGESPDSILLAKENYSFIVKEDNENAFIVCEIPSFGVKDGETSGETVVYDFEVIWDDNEAEYDISCTEIARFAGAVTAYCISEEDECIYFATDMNITKMTFDGTAEELVRVDYFYTLGVNSIVLFEGELYCGTALGIYRYNPKTKESHWYPMDYAKYVN